MATLAVERLQELCRAQGVEPAPERVRIVVEKAARRLRLWQGEALLATIPVIIGRQPLGHKQAEGDERTPEGTYRICYRNPESRFHRFLGLDYPNADDARAALRDGRLEPEACQALLAALAASGRPDWYTPLGGEVGIHGGGVDRAGTAGCVAMENGWIELLWEATIIGTPVEIRA